MSSLLLFLGDVGTSEMVLIVVVILVFFGANKIPELARGLGKGIREFKDASNEIRNEFERAGQAPSPLHQPYQPQPPYQAQQPDPYQQPAYQPYQPHPEGYPAPPVAPVDYSPPPVADYYPPTAPVAVTSPPAAPVPYPPDTPLPPNPGASGVPGTRPRLDQSHSDA